MAQKKLLTRQMVENERPPRLTDPRPPRSRRIPVPGIHPTGCLCGADHDTPPDPADA